MARVVYESFDGSVTEVAYENGCVIAHGDQEDGFCFTHSSFGCVVPDEDWSWPDLWCWPLEVSGQ